jgi:siroheme synthase (precorrin-2 oxidase/ferrochelatase)
MSNTLFPVFLRLDRLNTLVVGGGNVALEKVSALLRNSPEARVTMVAPFYREELLEYLADFPLVSVWSVSLSLGTWRVGMW